MADKRISQLVERTDIANNDVVPIVASGATTTNKATISSIQEFMQENLDLGVTSVGITLGSSGTDVSVTGSPITTSGNITINFPTASATNRGLLSSADWITFSDQRVPYTGATGNVDLGGFLLNASKLVANGVSSVSQSGSLLLKQLTNEANNTLGYTTISVSGSNSINFGVNQDASNSKNFSLSTTSITSNVARTYTLPDASGTLALTSDLSGYVTLDTAQTITAQKVFTTSGSSDSVIITHGSGSGFALDVIKAGNGEVVRVTKTSGSGNAMTVIGGDFEAPTIVKTGGTSSEFLKADGSVDSTAYYPNSNPSGFTSNVGTVTSVSGTGSVSGLTLSGTITSSGSLTLGGTLSLTSGNVTDALGFTPYNATNPAGYITSSALGDYLPLTGGTLTGPLSVTGNIDLLAGVNRQISLGSGTAYNYQVRANNDDFQLIEAGSHVFLAYTYGGSLGTGTIRLYNNTISTASFTGTSFIRSGGTSSQFLKADGSVDSNTYVTGGPFLPLSGGTLTGALNGTSASFITSATNIATFKTTSNNYSSLFLRMDNASESTSRNWGIFSDFGNYGELRIAPSSTNTGDPDASLAVLRIASTGAATFSSSVTAGGRIISGPGAFRNGGFYIPSSTADTGSRTWAMTNDELEFGDFSIVTSSTQTGDISLRRFYINPSGNVGIGNTNPFNGATSLRGIAISDRAALFQLNVNNHTYLTSNLYYDGTDWRRIVASGGSFLQLSDASGGELKVFGTASGAAGSVASLTERMQITSTGKVTINTTLTEGFLNIDTKSSAAYNPNSYNGNLSNIYLTNGSAGSGRFSGINFAGGSDTEGFFGVVQNSSNLAEFVFQTYNGSAYGERMRITSGGNVLIGTTTNSGAKLEVNGDIRTGALDGGYVAGYWKLGRALSGSQPSETHQIIVEINGALFSIGAAAL